MKIIKLQHAFNRGDLESKKLDLMAEVSNLKLKYATLEREKFETERKLRLSQVSFCIFLQFSLENFPIYF